MSLGLLIIGRHFMGSEMRPIGVCSGKDRGDEGPDIVMIRHDFIS